MIYLYINLNLDGEFDLFFNSSTPQSISEPTNEVFFCYT